MERNRENHLSWAATISIVIVVTLLAYLLSGALSGSNAGFIRSAVPLSIPASSGIKISGNRIFYYDGAQLHALNDSGSQRWNFPAGIDAEYSATEYGVATWTGSRLSLIDPESGATLYTGELSDTIISAKMSSTYAAAVLSPEHSGTILILERNGRQIDRITLDDQTVLDYGFFSNNDLFWVLSLNTQGSIPTCTISTYRPGKMITGSISDTDQIIYKVIFHSSTVEAFGLTYAKTYDYTCIEDQDARKLIYGWFLKDFEDTEGYTLQAYVPTDQTDGTNGIRDLKMVYGTYSRTARFPFAAKMIECKAGRIYGFSDQYVMSIGPGESKFSTYELPVRMERVVGMTESKKAVVISGGTVYLVSVP